MIALPVVLVLVLPPATLGASRPAQRRFVGSAISATAATSTGPLDFIDVAAAQSSDGDAAARGARGRAGHVGGIRDADASAPPDEILLTRYVVTCCVADATIAQVPGGRRAARDLPDDDG